MSVKANGEPRTSESEKNDGYLFSLKCIEKGRRSKFDVKVYFPPLSRIKDGQTKSVPSYPKIEAVKNHLLDTFYVAAQDLTEPHYVIMSAISFGRLRDRQMRDQEEIYVPIHAATFCHVCRVEFGDYLQHINQQRHIYKAKYSRYAKRIGNLCKEFASSWSGSKSEEVGQQPEEGQAEVRAQEVIRLDSASDGQGLLRSNYR